MTEQEIETRVERMINHLDRMYMSNAITKRQYAQAMEELNKWAEGKYAELARKDNVVLGVFA